jgi:hypothetical protein
MIFKAFSCQESGRGNIERIMRDIPRPDESIPSMNTSSLNAVDSPDFWHTVLLTDQGVPKVFFARKTWLFETIWLISEA